MTLLQYIYWKYVFDFRAVLAPKRRKDFDRLMLMQLCMLPFSISQPPVKTVWGVPGDVEFVVLDDKQQPPTFEPQPIIAHTFPLCANILLAARSGVGKTFMGIWIALMAFKRGLIRGAFFFSFEDANGMQMPRFHVLNGNKYNVMNRTEWNDILATERQRLEQETGYHALFYQQNRRLFEAVRIQENLLRGITEKHPFKLAVFLNLLREKITAGYNFFVIDSLSSVFGSLNNVSTALLEDFLSVASSAKVTFIVIHHCTGGGKIYGPDNIIQHFEAAYVLEKAKDSPESIETILQLRVEKDRLKMGGQDLFIKRTKVSEFEAEHQIIDVTPDKLSLENAMTVGKPKRNDRINAALHSLLRDKRDNGVIQFADLIAELEVGGLRVSKGSIKNGLRELERTGILHRDGTMIRLLDSEESSV